MCVSHLRFTGQLIPLPGPDLPVRAVVSQQINDQNVENRNWVTASLSAQGGSLHCSRPVWCLALLYPCTHCRAHVRRACLRPPVPRRPFSHPQQCHCLLWHSLPLGHFLHEQPFLIQRLQKVFSSWFLLIGLVVMFRFFISGLRYNSHTIHFTHLLGTNEWFLVY